MDQDLDPLYWIVYPLVVFLPDLKPSRRKEERQDKVINMKELHANKQVYIFSPGFVDFRPIRQIFF